MSQSPNLIPIERIQQVIFLIRGEKVMLDADLAALYGVEARSLNQAVARNPERFPPDFMFRLTKQEFESIRSQFVTGSPEKASNSSQTVMSSRKHRGSTYLPYAFTEQGVAMLSSVLRSQRAVEVNVAIMRAFVALRRLLSDNAALAKKLDELERKVIGHDAAIRSLFDAIRQLMAPPEKPGREIGFHTIGRERALKPRKKS
jgi:ATP-dependent Clp protease ATP-binding subunit ClpA